MRRFKFRAWHKQEHKMYKVTTIHSDFEGKELVRLAGSEFRTEEFWVGDDVELMQFTDLLDRNGKEIYEGDIVRVEGWDTGIVEFEKATYRVKCDDSRIALEDTSTVHIEIIGNAYENPGLVSIQLHD